MAVFLMACNDKNPAGPDENTAPPGMRAIKGGTFQMGSTTGFPDEVPVHTVTVSSFYIDTIDVTQADYVALMGVNPSSDTGPAKLRRPVDQVQWYDAVLYCNARSRRDGLDTVYSYIAMTGSPSTGGCTGLDSLKIDFSKNGYHLPTEAQWEYACRAGSTTAYFWGDDSSTIKAQYCWYYDNAGDSIHPVATRRPNAWGLYDMSGNVWQWCNDWFDDYSDYFSIQVDPTGPTKPGIYGAYHVLRGGSWMYNYGSWHVDGLLRSSARYGGNPGYWYISNCYCYGFRCAR